MEKTYTHALIIGNGFDLNLGLKTSYSDFIASDQFSKELYSKNELCHYLKNQHNLRQWIDIENELKRYSRESASPTYHSEYLRLCAALISYLKEIDYTTINETSAAFNLLREICNKDLLIIDFNYTNTTTVLLKHIEMKLNATYRVIKMHGSIEENQIIFGVEDKADIRLEHLFLLKAYHKNFNPIEVDKTLNEVENIHIFGHSLGETDHTYFKEFFYRSAEGFRNRKNYFLYHYGEAGKSDLFRQLHSLTGHNISGLRQRNGFKPIDSSSEDYPQ